MTLRQSFIVLGASMMMAGCALAPKVVHLENVSAVSEAKFTRPVCVVVGEFKDERKDPQIIGHTYNLGVKTSDVKTYGNVAEWVQSAYIRELEKAGSQKCDPSKSVIVSGTVKEINQEESWNINTSLKVDLKMHGKSNLDAAFEGKSSQVSHSASEGEFTDSLYKALQDLMRKSVPVLVSKAETTE